MMMPFSNDPQQDFDGAAAQDGFPPLGMLDPILPPLPPLGSCWMGFSLWVLSKQLQSGAIVDLEAFGNVFKFWDFGVPNQGSDTSWMYWQLMNINAPDSFEGSDPSSHFADSRSEAQQPFPQTGGFPVDFAPERSNLVPENSYPEDLGIRGNGEHTSLTSMNPDSHFVGVSQEPNPSVSINEPEDERDLLTAELSDKAIEGQAEAGAIEGHLKVEAIAPLDLQESTEAAILNRQPDSTFIHESGDLNPDLNEVGTLDSQVTPIEASPTRHQDRDRSSLTQDNLLEAQQPVSTEDIELPLEGGTSLDSSTAPSSPASEIISPSLGALNTETESISINFENAHDVSSATVDEDNRGIGDSATEPDRLSPASELPQTLLSQADRERTDPLLAFRENASQKNYETVVSQDSQQDSAAQSERSRLSIHTNENAELRSPEDFLKNECCEEDEIDRSLSDAAQSTEAERPESFTHELQQPFFSPTFDQPPEIQATTSVQENLQTNNTDPSNLDPSTIDSRESEMPEELGSLDGSSILEDQRSNQSLESQTVADPLQENKALSDQTENLDNRVHLDALDSPPIRNQASSEVQVTDLKAVSPVDVDTDHQFSSSPSSTNFTAQDGLTLPDQSSAPRPSSLTQSFDSKVEPGSTPVDDLPQTERKDLPSVQPGSNPVEPEGGLLGWLNRGVSWVKSKLEAVEPAQDSAPREKDLPQTAPQVEVGIDAEEGEKISPKANGQSVEVESIHSAPATSELENASQSISEASGAVLAEEAFFTYPEERSQIFFSPPENSLNRASTEASEPQSQDSSVSPLPSSNPGGQTSGTIIATENSSEALEAQSDTNQRSNTEASEPQSQDSSVSPLPSSNPEGQTSDTIIATENSSEALEAQSDTNQRSNTEASEPQSQDSSVTPLPSGNPGVQASGAIIGAESSSEALEAQSGSTLRPENDVDTPSPSNTIKSASSDLSRLSREQQLENPVKIPLSPIQEDFERVGRQVTIDSNRDLSLGLEQSSQEAQVFSESNRTDVPVPDSTYPLDTHNTEQIAVDAPKAAQDIQIEPFVSPRVVALENAESSITQYGEEEGISPEARQSLEPVRTQSYIETTIDNPASSEAESKQVQNSPNKELEIESDSHDREIPNSTQNFQALNEPEEREIERKQSTPVEVAEEPTSFYAEQAEQVSSVKSSSEPLVSVERPFASTDDLEAKEAINSQLQDNRDGASFVVEGEKTAPPFFEWPEAQTLRNAGQLETPRNELDTTEESASADEVDAPPDQETATVNRAEVAESALTTEALTTEVSVFDEAATGSLIIENSNNLVQGANLDKRTLELEEDSEGAQEEQASAITRPLDRPLAEELSSNNVSTDLSTRAGLETESSVETDSLVNPDPTSSVIEERTVLQVPEVAHAPDQPLAEDLSSEYLSTDFFARTGTETEPSVETDSLVNPALTSSGIEERTVLQVPEVAHAPDQPFVEDLFRESLLTDFFARTGTETEPSVETDSLVNPNPISSGGEERTVLQVPEAIALETSHPPQTNFIDVDSSSVSVNPASSSDEPKQQSLSADSLSNSIPNLFGLEEPTVLQSTPDESSPNFVASETIDSDANSSVLVQADQIDGAERASISTPDEQAELIEREVSKTNTNVEASSGDPDAKTVLPKVAYERVNTESSLPSEQEPGAIAAHTEPKLPSQENETHRTTDGVPETLPPEESLPVSPTEQPSTLNDISAIAIDTVFIENEPVSSINRDVEHSLDNEDQISNVSQDKQTTSALEKDIQTLNANSAISNSEPLPHNTEASVNPIVGNSPAALNELQNLSNQSEKSAQPPSLDLGQSSSQETLDIDFKSSEIEPPTITQPIADEVRSIVESSVTPLTFIEPVSQAFFNSLEPASSNISSLDETASLKTVQNERIDRLESLQNSLPGQESPAESIIVENETVTEKDGLKDTQPEVSSGLSGLPPTPLSSTETLPQSFIQNQQDAIAFGRVPEQSAQHIETHSASDYSPEAFKNEEALNPKSLTTGTNGSSTNEPIDLPAQVSGTSVSDGLSSNVGYDSLLDNEPLSTAQQNSLNNPEPTTFILDNPSSPERQATLQNLGTEVEFRNEPIGNDSGFSVGSEALERESASQQNSLNQGAQAPDLNLSGLDESSRTSSSHDAEAPPPGHNEIQPSVLESSSQPLEVLVDARAVELSQPSQSESLEKAIDSSSTNTSTSGESASPSSRANSDSTIFSEPLVDSEQSVFTTSQDIEIFPSEMEASTQSQAVVDTFSSTLSVDLTDVQPNQQSDDQPFLQGNQTEPFFEHFSERIQLSHLETDSSVSTQNEIVDGSANTQPVTISEPEKLDGMASSSELPLEHRAIADEVKSDPTQQPLNVNLNTDESSEIPNTEALNSPVSLEVDKLPTDKASNVPVSQIPLEAVTFIQDIPSSINGGINQNLAHEDLSSNTSWIEQSTPASKEQVQIANNPSISSSDSQSFLLDLVGTEISQTVTESPEFFRPDHSSEPSLLQKISSEAIASERIQTSETQTNFTVESSNTFSNNPLNLGEEPHNQPSPPYSSSHSTPISDDLEQKTILQAISDTSNPKPVTQESPHSAIDSFSSVQHDEIQKAELESVLTQNEQISILKENEGNTNDLPQPSSKTIVPKLDRDEGSLEPSLNSLTEQSEIIANTYSSPYTQQSETLQTIERNSERLTHDHETIDSSSRIPLNEFNSNSSFNLQMIEQSLDFLGDVKPQTDLTKDDEFQDSPLSESADVLTESSSEDSQSLVQSSINEGASEENIPSDWTIEVSPLAQDSGLLSHLSLSDFLQQNSYDQSSRRKSIDALKISEKHLQKEVLEGSSVKNIFAHSQLNTEINTEIISEKSKNNSQYREFPTHWNSLEELVGSNTQSLNVDNLELETQEKNTYVPNSWTKIEDLINFSAEEDNNQSKNNFYFSEFNFDNSHYGWSDLSNLIHSLKSIENNEASEDLLLDLSDKNEKQEVKNDFIVSKENFSKESYNIPSRDQFIQIVAQEIQLRGSYDFQSSLTAKVLLNHKESLNSYQSKYPVSFDLLLIEDVYERMCAGFESKNLNLIVADLVELISKVNRRESKDLSFSRRHSNSDLF